MHLNPKQMRQIITKFREPFMYGIIGVIATVIDFVILVTLTDYVKIDYRASVVIAFLFAAIFNFYLQKKFTFRCNKSEIKKQFIQFISIGSIGMLINLAIITICVEIFNIWYVIGKIIATFIAFIWNYFANKLVTFKQNA